jgi:acetylxylan esterase
MLSAITPTLLLILPFITAAQTTAAPSASPTCAPVHIIASRASGEAPGEGIIGSFSTLVKQMIPGSTSEALVYPASMPYSGSIPIGVTNLKSAIASYSSACPTSKLVLMGYSQGAAVTVDTLCSGGGTYVPPDAAPTTTGLSAAEGQNVVVAVMMGDPRFVPRVTYGAGTNTDKGGVSCPIVSLR